ncbi:M20/M25/M40 family metallo-hydrolase [Anaerohalosphaeraceae bacterium U12dextr]
MKSQIISITNTFLQNPTAPYREGIVRQAILQFCTDRGIQTTVDKMGNILAVFGAKYSNTPLTFVAHQDHPGFIIEKDSVRNKTTALFYGGVEKSYFHKGTPIRVFTSTGSIPGRITQVQFDDKNKRKRVWLALNGPAQKGDLAMWDLPTCQIQDDLLHSRACDDLIGCAAILCLFDQLHRRKIRRKVLGLFTVAEEAGLHGAKYVCKHKSLPQDRVIISIETSSALPTAPIGKGVVIRVGDRSRIFNPSVIQWMVTIAANLQKQDKTFLYQRQLMDAGTCEASIFTQFGYTTGAVCIPLGNYHNRDAKKGVIASEIVSVNDYLNMIKLFLALVIKGGDAVQLHLTKMPTYKKRIGELGELFLE